MTQKVWLTPRTWPKFDATTADEEEAQRWRDAGYQVNEYVKVEPAAAGDDGGSSPAPRRSLHDQLIRFVQFVDLWINRPNLSDEERVSIIKHQPRSKEFAEAVGEPAYPPAPQPSRAAPAEDVERVAEEINKARYDIPDGLPYRPLTHSDAHENEYCRRLARAALAAIPDRRREHLLEAVTILSGPSIYDLRKGIEAIRAAADAAPGDTGQEGTR